MHYLMLRVTFENKQYGHKIIYRGTRGQCETEAWHTDISAMRGPGMVKAELIVIDKEAWQKILALQVRRRW